MNNRFSSVAAVMLAVCAFTPFGLLHASQEKIGSEPSLGAQYVQELLGQYTDHNVGTTFYDPTQASPEELKAWAQYHCESMLKSAEQAEARLLIDFDVVIHMTAHATQEDGGSVGCSINSERTGRVVTRGLVPEVPQ